MVAAFAPAVVCFPLLPADPEVLYLHAKACFDCDHKDDLGGYNIQTYLEMLQVCQYVVCCVPPLDIASIVFRFTAVRFVSSRCIELRRAAGSTLREATMFVVISCICCPR